MMEVDLVWELVCDVSMIRHHHSSRTARIVNLVCEGKGNGKGHHVVPSVDFAASTIGSRT
jgi:hypothetical protein